MRAPALADAPAAVFGPRYLRYLAVGLLLLGLFERSDILSPPGQTIMVAVVTVVAVLGLAVGLRLASGTTVQVRNPSNYLVPLMAVLVAAAVTNLILDWRLFFVTQAVAATAFFASAYVTLERFIGRERPGHQFLRDASVILVLLGSFVAILVGVTGVAPRLTLISVAAVAAAYDGMARVSTRPGLTVMASLIVGEVVAAIAFGLMSYQFLDVSRLAPILLAAWYVNRGFGVHLLEGTLSPRIFGEYAFIALLCGVLIASALVSR